MDFAYNLRRLMTINGISNYQLAKDIECHQSNVAYWLSGDRVPQQRMRKAIADYFGVPIDFLMGTGEYSDVLIWTAIEDNLIAAKNAKTNRVAQGEHLGEDSGEIDRPFTNDEDKRRQKVERIFSQKEKSPAPEGAEHMSVDELLDRLSQAELVELMAKTAAKLKERGLE